MTLPATSMLHNTDAERCALGTCLLNEEAIISVVAIIGDDPNAFYIHSHQQIYSAILDLYRDGDPVDMVTVCNHLMESGNISKAGGATYVAGLLDAVPTSHNAAWYARIVKESAHKRDVAALCKRAITRLEMPGERVEHVLQDIITRATAGCPDALEIDYLRDWEALAKENIDSVFEQGLFIGKMGVLTAEGGTGKSFLALQLALSVALDREIVAGFKPTRDGRVLCCFGEDDNLVVSKRLQAIADGLNIGPEFINGACRFGKLSFLTDRAFPLLSVDALGSITRTSGFLEFRDRVAREKYRLIILDPLVAWAGIPNENDNAAMQAVASAVIDIAKASEGAVLVVHHANKAGNRTGDMSQASGRGASSLQDAARWVASMRQFTDKDMKEYGMEAQSKSLYVALYISKNSYAPRSADVVTLTRLRGGVLKPIDLGQTKSDLVADNLMKVFDDMPRGTEVSPNDLYRRQGAVASEIRDRLDQLTGYAVSRESVQDAVTHCLQNGYLLRNQSTKSGAGRPREILRANDF